MSDARMRICGLLALLLAVLTGCGASDPAPQPAAFDLDGAWLYLGPSDVPHTLTVGKGAMVYTDVDGHWSSTWTIKTYDNAARHFRLVFDSGSGAYLPAGTSLRGAYDVSGALLTVQVTSAMTYPELLSPGTCTDAVDGTPVPECRLYIKKN
ncbi:MAG: hypothetical protein ABJB12_02155 [Pseudomonadota bacterium]